MSLLSNLTTSSEIQGEEDRVGGGFTPLESDIYKSTVTLAYLEKSQGGALALSLTFMTADNREIRQKLWMTSGDAKGNKNYYTDSKGEMKHLPGFILANSLCQLTTGKEINALETEKKTIALYNYESKAEVPTTVDMLTEVMNKEIYVALFKQIVDKNVKNEATGNYEATGETREENEIDKFFCALDGHDKLTTVEIQGGATDPVFYETWKNKWTGKTRDRVKGKSAGAGQAGAPTAAATNQANKKPPTSLFS